MPDFFFPDRDFFPFFRIEDEKEKYLHFHACMTGIERLSTFRTMHHRYGSPTSVTYFVAHHNQGIHQYTHTANNQLKSPDGVSTGPQSQAQQAHHHGYHTSYEACSNTTNMPMNKRTRYHL